MGRLSEKIFCAFCSVPRKVYTKKHLSWTNVLLALVTAFVVMVPLWGGYDSRVFILFTLFLAAAETFIQIRWRMSINCPFCGFDPVLYQKDRQALVKKIRHQLEQVKHKPGLLLSKYNPLENLPQRPLGEVRSEPSKELPSS